MSTKEIILAIVFVLTMGFLFCAMTFRQIKHECQQDEKIENELKRATNNYNQYFETMEYIHFAEWMQKNSDKKIECFSIQGSRVYIIYTIKEK